jgi:hypothetical protein
MIVPMLVADDLFVGWGTLVLAIATFALAGIAFWQLMDSRAERRITEKSLEIAEATLRAQQQPELIAFQSPEGGPEREVHLAAYGALPKPVGQVWVRGDLMNANVAVVSIDVRNVGAGGAEVTRVRLMSLGAPADGREPEYWEPNASEQRLAVVAAGGTAPVDLVMAPVPPRWFYSHLKYGTKLWVEVTYRGLEAVDDHVRWFEFEQRNYSPHPWFVSQILRSEPQPFIYRPPANPLVGPI